MINHTKHNDSAHKLLSDNRASYFAQSAATKGGKVPPYQHITQPRKPQ